MAHTPPRIGTSRWAVAVSLCAQSVVFVCTLGSGDALADRFRAVHHALTHTMSCHGMPRHAMPRHGMPRLAILRVRTSSERYTLMYYYYTTTTLLLYYYYTTTILIYYYTATQLLAGADLL